MCMFCKLPPQVITGSGWHTNPTQTPPDCVPHALPFQVRPHQDNTLLAEQQLPWDGKSECFHGAC